MEQKEMIEEIADIRQRGISNTRRIDKLEKAQADLTELVTSVALIAQKQTQMETGIEEIRNDVKKLTEKPASRWETAITVALTAIVSGLIAYVLLRLGLI